MQNGKWEMENGNWKMENGKWKNRSGNRQAGTGGTDGRVRRPQPLRHCMRTLGNPVGYLVREKCINRCENRAMNFIFGANDFKNDSGASEKDFIFLKIVNFFDF